MLTPGQVLSSYILKPLRKDLASIISFIPSLLIFGGQNLIECAHMLMSNLHMTSKRFHDDVGRPDFGGQWLDCLQTYVLGISIPNAWYMQNLWLFCQLGTISGLQSHIK